MKRKLVKPQSKQDIRVLCLYNSENGVDACCPSGNGQCTC